MNAALHAMNKEGMSAYKAEKIYGVPKRTLLRHQKGIKYVKLYNI